MTQAARPLSARLAAAAALLVIAAATLAGCGGSPVAPAAGVTPGGPTRPAASPTRGVQLTGHLCADAAAVNSGIRVLTQALILHHGGQQVTTLLHAVVAAYTALGTESPAPVKGAFAALASYYQSVEAKVAGGGQLTPSDIEPAAHASIAPAVREASRYFLAHCAG